MIKIGRLSLGSPYRARTWLILLVLAMILPLAVLSSALFVRQLAVDQAETERLLLERTKLLSDEIDLELARVTVAAQLLASSRSLATNDLPGFYEEAKRAANLMNATVVLRDSSGHQLVN